jgi:hypothetical protein
LLLVVCCYSGFQLDEVQLKAVKQPH